MARQRNKKEQENFPEELDEMGVRNLSDREFKVMIIRYSTA